ncbi:MAG TPA: OmpA family protein [Polyangiaceae bacterium]|nr:OmpA family protein [Polyangiaceae bacterium]
MSDQRLAARTDFRRAALRAFVPALVLAACVPKDRYDAALADAQSVHAQFAASLEHAKAQDAEIANLRQELADAESQTQQRDQKLSDLSTSDHNLQAQLDEGTAINAKLRGELERLGKNVDGMLQEKGTLSKALDDAKARLDELRKAQAAAEARAQLFQQFVQKLKKMIDAGQLKVGTRAGRLVIALPNDVLFDSGQTAIKPAGKEALGQLARVLVTVRGRAFQVGGHTDNVPIQTARFPSNWELSTARAVEVVKLLIAQNEDPHALSASGYGEFDPIASNDSPEGRAKNRRIELTLQPNLDELVAAPAIR